MAGPNQPGEREASPHGGRRPSTGGFHGRGDKQMKRRIGGAGGFTLLEVLIAVAILAVSLSSLMGSQINSMAATRYARDISAIALLAEYQLVEIEFQHRKEGFVNSDVELEGDFSDHGYDDVEWVCTIHFIELPEYNEMLEAKEGVDDASGEGDDNVMDTGDQAFAGLGAVWSIVKHAIEASIRKVDCTVTWQQGNIEQEFMLQTFWTDPAGLQQLPGAGGEFTDADDPSGANEEGGAGKPGGETSGGGMLPPSRGGSTAPGGGMGMGGGKG
jgi:prepilin-type N-terminal cleavage/methylation domain-containing protein